MGVRGTAREVLATSGILSWTGWVEVCCLSTPSLSLQHICFHSLRGPVRIPDGNSPSLPFGR